MLEGEGDARSWVLPNAEAQQRQDNNHIEVHFKDPWSQGSFFWPTFASKTISSWKETEEKGKKEEKPGSPSLFPGAPG